MDQRLVMFLYAAMQKMPLGDLENLVIEAEQVEVKEFTKEEFKNPRLALYARDLADRLTKRAASEKLKAHLNKNRP